MREFNTDASGETTIGRKDVVYNRTIDKRHTKISRNPVRLYRATHGNVMMLQNNHTTAPVVIDMNGDTVTVAPTLSCSIASGGCIILNGMQDDDKLRIEYDFGKDVFSAETDAGSDTEHDADPDQTQMESQQLEVHADPDQTQVE